MEMIKTSAEVWLAAVQGLVKLRITERGGLKRLADNMGIKPGYLTDLLCGRRNWSDNFRDKFANIMGVSVADVYAIGEEKIKTGHIFPYNRALNGAAPSSVDRAVKIVALVFVEFKLGRVATINADFVKGMFPTELDAYLEGHVPDGAFYKGVKTAIAELLKFYLKQ
jgi:hypothetical protein